MKHLALNRCDTPAVLPKTITTYRDAAIFSELTSYSQ